MSLTALACGEDGVGPEPGPNALPDIVLVTTIPDVSGIDGSAFIQTVSLEEGSATNVDAFEQVFFPYASIHGNDVIITQGLSGDEAVRYVRGQDGHL